MSRIPTIRQEANYAERAYRAGAPELIKRIDPELEEVADTARDYLDAVDQARSSIAQREAVRAQNRYLENAALRRTEQAAQLGMKIPKGSNVILKKALPKLVGANPFTGVLDDLIDPEGTVTGDAEAKAQKKADQKKKKWGDPSVSYRVSVTTTTYRFDINTGTIIGPFAYTNTYGSFGGYSAYADTLIVQTSGFGNRVDFNHLGSFRGSGAAGEVGGDTVIAMWSNSNGDQTPPKYWDTHTVDASGIPFEGGKPAYPWYDVPPPHDRKPRDNGDGPMGCCDDLMARISRIERVLQVRDFPLQTPTGLLNLEGQEKEVSHAGYADLIGWQTRQMDSLVGEFPIEVKIDDIDPLTSGNQSKTIQIPNVAESIADLYGMIFSITTMKDVQFQMLVRLAGEVISAKNAALVGQSYARATADYLGFTQVPTSESVKYSFDISAQNNVENLLREATGSIQGVKNESKETAHQYFQKLMFSAGIIKATHFRRLGQAGQLINELKPFFDTHNQVGQDDWDAFVDNFNDPLGVSNINQDTQVKIVKVQQAGK